MSKCDTCDSLDGKVYSATGGMIACLACARGRGWVAPEKPVASDVERQRCEESAHHWFTVVFTDKQPRDDVRTLADAFERERKVVRDQILAVLRAQLATEEASRAHLGSSPYLDGRVKQAMKAIEAVEGLLK